MAYCSSNEDSQIYLVDTGEYIECVGCQLGKIEETVYYFRSEVLKHLKVHRDYDHEVPEYVFERLKYEIENLGDEVSDGKGLTPEQLYVYLAIKEVLDPEDVKGILNKDNNDSKD